MKTIIKRINFLTPLLQGACILCLLFPWTLYFNDQATVSYPNYSRIADGMCWYAVFAFVCSAQKKFWSAIISSSLFFAIFHILWFLKKELSGGVLVAGDIALLGELIKNHAWESGVAEAKIILTSLAFLFSILILSKNWKMPSLVLLCLCVCTSWFFLVHRYEKTTLWLGIRDGYHIKNAFQSGPLFYFLYTYVQKYYVYAALPIECTKSEPFTRYDLPLEKRKSVYIITIESLFDPSQEPGAVLSADPFYPAFRRALNNQGTNVFVGTRGGGSAATEFETLCGYPSTLLTNTSGSEFAYLIDKPLGCLPSILSEAGYTTAAFYPTQTLYFNELNAYRYLGFENIFLFKDLKPTGLDGHYLSDTSLYDQMIEWRLKQKKESPVFMYAMTVASHYPHPLNHQVRPDIIKGSDPTLVRAANRFYYSTKEFFEFASKIKKIDPDALIIGYGDHHPIPYIMIADSKNMRLVEKALTVPMVGIGTSPDLSHVFVPYQIPAVILHDLGLDAALDTFQRTLLDPETDLLRPVAYLPTFLIHHGALNSCEESRCLVQKSDVILTLAEKLQCP